MKYMSVEYVICNVKDSCWMVKFVGDVLCHINDVSCCI